MKRLMALLTLLVASSAPLSAQNVNTGLLLGTAECWDDACQKPMTYWIVRDGNQVRIAAQGSGLLLPRKDGFWWVGFESGWSAREMSETEEVEVCEVATQSPPTTSNEDATDDHEADADIPSVIWAARADAGADAGIVADTLYGGRLRLNWLGPDWLALTESGSDDREHIWVTQWIVPFPAIENTGAEPGLFAADSAQMDVLLRECRERLFGEAEDGEEDFRRDISFAVERLATRWTISAWPSDMRFRDDASGCPMPREAAPAPFGHDRVTVAWSAIKDVLPGASTAFESPAGDLLLVVQESTLYAFLPRNGAPGSVVARFALPGKAVMTEWSVGAHARRWTREVPAMLEKGAPAYIRGK